MFYSNHVKRISTLAQPIVSAWDHKPGFRILIFHHIVDLARFGNLLVYLQRHFTFKDPADSDQWGKGPGDILLSFDDVFSTNIQAAREVLNPMGLKALFFVLSDFVEAPSEQQKIILRNIFLKEMPPGEFQSPSWEDLRFLVHSGHTLGAHTRTHRLLTAIDDNAQLRKEIVGSGDILEERLGQPVRWFANPFGDMNSLDRRAYKIIEQRYDFCCTGLRGKNASGQRCLWREAINPALSDGYIRFVVSGGWDWLYRSRRHKTLLGIHDLESFSHA